MEIDFMAFTQTDLDNVRAAILSLAMGERVVRVDVQGHVTEFAPAQLNELRALRSEIQAELRSASGFKPIVRIKTSKGL